jgi:trehalose/maltose hydrolase-like predicted phosphorylase
LTGPLEHHITADIAIACWNYYCVTHDLHWLRSHGYPLMKAVADFWVSRAERNEDGSYSIRSVVGADEYAMIMLSPMVLPFVLWNMLVRQLRLVDT